MLITASQIQWTTDVTKALMTNKERDDCSALKSLKKKQVGIDCDNCTGGCFFFVVYYLKAKMHQHFGIVGLSKSTFLILLRGQESRKSIIGALEIIIPDRFWLFVCSTLPLHRPSWDSYTCSSLTYNGFVGVLAPVLL